MAGPTDVLVRQPVVAGMFYPADADACRSAAAELLSAEDDGKQIEPGDRDLLGAIVPHAGWICSGRIAGEAIATLARSAREKVDAVVIFGAIHTPIAIDVAALDSAKTWRVAGGASEVIDDVRGALRENTDLFATDDRVHADEPP